MAAAHIPPQASSLFVWGKLNPSTPRWNSWTAGLPLSAVDAWYVVWDGWWRQSEQEGGWWGGCFFDGWFDLS